MSEPFLGELRIFGFNFPPRGWAQCNGQLLAISTDTALFALLGTTYGGNGTTTFALPDLRGRAPIGQGQGPGLQNYVMGEAAGTESTTLLQSNLPPHTHTLLASPTKSSLQAPAAGAFLGKTVDGGTTGAVPKIYVPAGSEGTTVPLGGVGITGSGVPFSILDPFLTLNFCIARQGIFPSRS